MKRTEGNKLIADYVGIDFNPELKRAFINGKWKHQKLYFHENWNWLMPVIRKIVEQCCDQDNDHLFESDQYTSILDTVPLAIIEDAYKVVVEFIEWYNLFPKDLKQL